jgi:hypothetical protein
MAVAEGSLATLDEIKDFYQFGSTKQIDDDLLEDLSDRVTKLFETYCEVKSFYAADYTDVYDGSGDKYLFLNNTPINSVSEVNEDSDWVWASDTTVGSTEYRVIDKKYLVMKDDLFTCGDQNYRITYNAGYATIPLDIKQVAIEEIVRRYKHRKDFDVVAKSLEDGNVTYTEKGLLTGTKKVLDRYRQNWVW